MNTTIVKFPESTEVERDWGYEQTLVVASGKYAMKKLFLKKGKKGGLQFHMRKDEAIYVLHGKLIVRYEDEQGNLREKICGPGDYAHFPNGAVHQEEAIEDTLILECTTPHANDRVRVDSENEQKEFGLQTTREDEIKYL